MMTAVPTPSFRIGLVLLLSALAVVSGFVVHTAPQTSAIQAFRRHHRCSFLRQLSAAESSSSTENDVSYDSLFSETPDYQVLDVVLSPHRPLGCTVEESLADSQFVFVTRVTEGGYAQTAGLQVGDTLLQVSGIFGDLTSVVGVGVEKLKGMVSSRPEEEPLALQVARGTNVFDEHEKAVVELCSTDAGDVEVEQCVVDYLSMDSKDEAVRNKQAAVEEEEECDMEGDDADCMVGNMMDLWAADLPDLPPQPKDLGSMEEPAEKVKPWSSRSSGSGTYVRDPVTGEMKNIDA